MILYSIQSLKNLGKAKEKILLSHIRLIGEKYLTARLASYSDDQTKIKKKFFSLIFKRSSRYAYPLKPQIWIVPFLTIKFFFPMPVPYELMNCKRRSYRRYM